MCLLVEVTDILKRVSLFKVSSYTEKEQAKKKKNGQQSQVIVSPEHSQNSDAKQPEKIVSNSINAAGRFT